MYYYLDRGKYKEKDSSSRAKLYITRLQQEGKKKFLLQFVVQHLTVAQIGLFSYFFFFLFLLILTGILLTRFPEQKKKIQQMKKAKRIQRQKGKPEGFLQDSPPETLVSNLDTPLQGPLQKWYEDVQSKGPEKALGSMPNTIVGPWGGWGIWDLRPEGGEKKGVKRKREEEVQQVATREEITGVEEAAMEGPPRTRARARQARAKAEEEKKGSSEPYGEGEAEGGRRAKRERREDLDILPEPVLAKYQHYPVLHKAGYRGTFPPPNTDLAFSLGRVHLDSLMKKMNGGGPGGAQGGGQGAGEGRQKEGEGGEGMVGEGWGRGGEGLSASELHIFPFLDDGVQEFRITENIPIFHEVLELSSDFFFPEFRDVSEILESTEEKKSPSEGDSKKEKENEQFPFSGVPKLRSLINFVNTDSLV
jgi:hypothetical protein